MSIFFKITYLQKFAILLVLVSSPSFSQSDTNRVLIGGNANFRTGSIIPNTLKKGLQFSVAPKFGYFISKNFVAGINADIRYYNNDKGAAVGKSISVGPLVRYYFCFRKSAVVMEVGYSYGQSNDNSIHTFTYPTPLILTIESRVKFNQYSVGAGYTYFIKDNVSIEALYQFQIVQETYSDNYSYYISSPNSRKSNSAITAGLLFYF